MRENKFRAWAGGVMVYFDLFNITHTDGLDDNKHFRRTERPQLSVSSICPIMQYTGLKDKNGKEIFEGDCLKIWNPAYKKDSVVVVEYHAPSFKVYFPSANPHLIDWNDLPTLPGEVIGNIYENPELLR